MQMPHLAINLSRQQQNSVPHNTTQYKHELNNTIVVYIVLYTLEEKKKHKKVLIFTIQA